MPPYDPAMIAVMHAMLTALDASAAEAAPGYLEQLRALQRELTSAIATGQEAPSPEAEQTVREGLRFLDPKPDDRRLGYGAVLPRLLAAVDQELFKWTSAPVQPRGPSGETAVSAPPPAPEEETHG